LALANGMICVAPQACPVCTEVIPDLGHDLAVIGAAWS
jgi:hypothetical protein